MALPSQWQGASASQISIAKVPITPPEMYIPLWWYSGTAAATGTSTEGAAFLQKGSISLGAFSSTGAKLYTVNANWNPNNKYVLEVTTYTSSNTGYIELWDMSGGGAVVSSRIAVTNTTATVLRSGQFTLTPGHPYGITLWSNNGQNTYVTDASLIVFPS